MKRRTVSDIGDRREGVAAHLDPTCIDAGGRDDEARGVEVGGGYADRAPQLVAGHDESVECVRASQAMCGFVEISAADEFADACAADRFLLESDGFNAVDMEAFAPAGFTEEGEVACLSIAEYEVGTDTQGSDGCKEALELGEKIGGGQMTERWVKGDCPGPIDSGVVEEAYFPAERVDEEGLKVRRDHGGGVDGESDGKCQAVALAGMGDGFLEHALVTDVNAVEESNG